jgi:hypothetical protein
MWGRALLGYQKHIMVINTIRPIMPAVNAAIACVALNVRGLWQFVHLVVQIPLISVLQFLQILAFI